MKKYFLILFCAVLLLGIVGCGKTSKVVCSKTTTEEGLSAKEEAIFELDSDDKVVKASGTVTFDDESTAQTYCEIFKTAIDSQYADLISCVGKTITITDLGKFADEEDESEKIIGMSKEDLIKLETDDGYTCE